MKRAAPIVVLMLGAACGPDTSNQEQRAETESTGPLRIVAVNYPLAYMAERIGGGMVSVELPMPADVDPAYWQPTPDEIAALQDADLILLNGADYAKWTATATLPESKLVNTSAAAADRYVALTGAVTHTHGPEGEHSHGEVAFTTWLDPTIAAAQAQAVAEALSAARPDEAASFEANRAQLAADLEALDARLAAAMSRLPNGTAIGSHPVYQYLAARYDVEIPSVHFEPDAMPDEAGWHDLRHVLSDSPTSVMLWEAEPTAETAGRLERLGLTVVVFAPTGNRPGTGDYLSAMGANVERLEAL